MHLAKNLQAQVKPHEQSLSKLIEALRKHYKPKRVVIAEQFTFHRRNQGAEESVAEYVVELHKLTLNCDFKGHLDKALRDRFICGLQREATQKQLLTESELTFTRAVEIMKGMEAADKKSRQFKGAIDGIVNKLSNKPLHSPVSVAVNEIIRPPAVTLKMLNVITVGKSTHFKSMPFSELKSAIWVKTSQTSERESNADSAPALAIAKVESRLSYPIGVANTSRLGGRVAHCEG